MEEGIFEKVNADGAPSGMWGEGYSLLGFEYFIILKCVKYCFLLPSLPHIKKIKFNMYLHSILFITLDMYVGQCQGLTSRAG